MQPQQPYLVKNIDLDNILYSDIREVGSKKYIQMGYNDPKKGEQRFMYQSPEFYNVYDIKLAESGNYYELEIPLYGDQKRKITEFIKFITKTDQKNIEYGKDNIGKMFDLEKEIKPRYKSTIRLSKDNDYYNKNGIIKIKIHFDTVIIENGKRISPNDIKKGTSIRFIFENLALWIQQDGFGMFIKPILIEQKKKQIMEAFSFAEDSDDSEDDEYSNYGDTEIEPSNMFVPFNYEKKQDEKETVVEESNEVDNNNNEESNEDIVPVNDDIVPVNDDSMLYAEDGNDNVIENQESNPQTDIKPVSDYEDSVKIETINEETAVNEYEKQSENKSNMDNIFITETEDVINSEQSNKIKNKETLTIDIYSDEEADEEVDEIKML